jgi:hypothetical protein
MEEEARDILEGALLADGPEAQNLAQAIRKHIEPLGGVDLTPPKRLPARRPPALTRARFDLGPDRAGRLRVPPQDREEPLTLSRQRVEPEER